jgi:hypothetical protein
VRRAGKIVSLMCIALLTPVVFAFGGDVLNERAMTRCEVTPPGFPKRLIRAGVGMSVETRLFPPRTTCVYDYGGRVIAKRPPP